METNSQKQQPKRGENVEEPSKENPTKQAMIPTTSQKHPEGHMPAMMPPNYMYYYPPGYGYHGEHQGREEYLNEMPYYPPPPYPPPMDPSMMMGHGRAGNQTTTTNSQEEKTSNNSRRMGYEGMVPPYPYMPPMYPGPMAMYPPYYNEMMYMNAARASKQGSMSPPATMAPNKETTQAPMSTPPPPPASPAALQTMISKQQLNLASSKGRDSPQNNAGFEGSDLEMTPKKRTSGRVQYDSSGMMFSEDSITEVANSIFSGSTANPILSRPRYQQTPRKRKAFHKMDLLNHVEIPRKKPRVYENDKFNRGIWTDKEHRRFLEGIRMYSRGKWKEIAEHVGTRSRVQVASHAQKYFARREEEGIHHDDEDDEDLEHHEEVETES